MNTARKINAIIWTMVFLFCAIATIITWANNICRFEQLIMALFFYGACSAGLGFFFDQTIQGK